MTVTVARFYPREHFSADGVSKRRYRRRRVAKKAAKRAGTGVKAYRCGYCDEWHVGHPPEAL